MGERVQVYSVEKVKVDVLKKKPPGFEVSSDGKVRSGGYSKGRLDARLYAVPPADGMQELDFTAEKPDGPSTSAIAKIKSDTLTVDPAPPWLRGFRVIAETNSVEQPV